MTALDDASSNLHAATPPGWYVGRPTYIEGRGVWEQYAFDPSERAQVGARSREWTAVAATEVEVIRELARYLRLIREGQVPGWARYARWRSRVISNASGQQEMST